MPKKYELTKDEIRRIRDYYNDDLLGISDIARKEDIPRRSKTCCL